MLPQFLSSSYQAYKKDTAILLQWLSDTANKCGFAPTIQMTEERPEETPKSSQRLKGKERKQARIAAAKGDPDGTPQEKRKASIKDFLLMANTITSRKPFIAVPETIMKAGLRAVSARREFAAWFNCHVVHKETDNEGHWFFIELLEEIVATLSSNYDPAAEKKDMRSTHKKSDAAHVNTKATAKEHKKTLENLFHLLDLEEPTPPIDPKSNGSLLQQDLITTGGALTFRRDVVYDVEGHKDFAKENALFAAFSLFQDLQQFRLYVRQLWSSYVSGDMDLISVAVITNTTFDLARRTEDDFKSTFPALESADVVTELMLDALPEYASVSTTEYIEDWIFRMPFKAFRMFRKDIIPVLPENSHLEVDIKTCDLSKDRSAMSYWERGWEDMTLLVALLIEARMLNSYEAHLPAQDELTRGLREFLGAKNIPVWLTFAAQIYLDIHHDMREKVSSGFGRLQLFAQQAKKTVMDYKHSTQTPSTKVPTTRLSMGSIDKLIMILDFWYLGDAMLPMRSNTTSSTEQFYLLRSHPLLCGIMSFHVILKLHDIGISFANERCMLTIAHFYNLVRQQKSSLTKVWRDMDLMIELQSKEYLFLEAFLVLQPNATRS